MIEAIRDDNSKGFKQKLSGYDLLLIDNLQFIAGKEATQEEFFKIVSVLLESGKSVIIASTQPPQAITIMNERFTSMFELGGVFEIKGPDLDTRLEILRRRRAEGNFELLDEEISSIAGSTSDNVRELLNAFNRFVAYDEMTEEHENLS
jgi:chromosomal replication initiator protein